MKSKTKEESLEECQEAEREALKRITAWMARNPIPPEAPRFTREELHERSKEIDYPPLPYAPPPPYLRCVGFDGTCKRRYRGQRGWAFVSLRVPGGCAFWVCPECRVKFAAYFSGPGPAKPLPRARHQDPRTPNFR
jgi:hypothetical protein